MTKKRNILCIVAHPDDEALGLGGSLIKHVQYGDKVFIIILSQGETSKAKNNEKNPKRLVNAKDWSAETGCTLYNVLLFVKCSNS